MNNGKRKLWLAGVAGLVFVVVNTAALLLDFVVGGDPTVNVATIGADLVRTQESAAWTWAAMLRVLQFVPLALFIPGIYWAFRHDGDRGFAVFGALSVFLYALFMTIQNVATAVVIMMLGPVYTPGSPAAAGIEAAALALFGFGDVFFRPGGGLATLFLVFGLALLGWLTLQGGRLPRWTGYVALVSAGASLLGYLQYLVPPFLFLGALLGVGLFVVWTLGVSISLIRAPAPASAQAQAGGQMAA